MDSVRERLNENQKSRQKKYLFAIILLIILVIVFVLLELRINSRISDIVIKKSNISDEKAIFIPVKPLDTNIIAVNTSEGDLRLAFDDCTGCYNQYGKRYGFENNENNTGLICKNCKNVIMYDEMGFLPEESMPLPIFVEAENGIENKEDRIVISAEYLERMKEEFAQMRGGKSLNNYKEKRSE